MKTHPMLTRRIHFLLLSIFLYNNRQLQAESPTQELLKGFSATPDSSISTFQPLLTDPTASFAFGFLRADESKLSLAILHLPSSEPIWIAKTASSLKWSKSSHLFFYGSLSLSDTHIGAIWSTKDGGDRVVLLNNSNLQVQKRVDDGSYSIVWQSFDFPSDTLISSQNFTAKMSLTSSNGLYSMRLGNDYLGLYQQESDQIYWKRRAMQAKATVIPGKGPIYMQINSNGYLGMYQTEIAPVDVQPFTTFQRNIFAIRRLKLEDNGNLKAYYWNQSSWINEFTAITDYCDLPNSCGSYGLCRADNICECLDNATEYRSGKCLSPESGDLCSDKPNFKTGYSVIRRNGVELPYSEWMEFNTMGSLQECENSCEKNCSCWGAVFHNASGYCYLVDYPIGSLTSVGDESRIGYFKVRKVAEKKINVGYIIGASALVCAFVLLVGFAAYGIRRLRRSGRSHRFIGEGVSPGPYKDLGSASFRSLELTKTSPET